MSCCTRHKIWVGTVLCFSVLAANVSSMRSCKLKQLSEAMALVKSIDWPLYRLVGGFNPSEKYEFVSWDDYSQWKVIKFMFQTTNQ